MYLLGFFTDEKTVKEYCKKYEPYILTSLKNIFGRKHFVGLSSFKFDEVKMMPKYIKVQVNFKANIPWYDDKTIHDKLIEIEFNYDPKDLIYEIFEFAVDLTKIDLVTINIIDTSTGEIRQRRFNNKLKAIR